MTYTIKFSLWDSAMDGGELWSEEKSISLTGPKMKTYLGEVNGLEGVDFSRQLWVQVERRKADGTYRPLGGREALGVVPYALYSESSGSGEGSTVTGITAGTGLTGGGTSGDVTLSLGMSYRLPQACVIDQAPKWNGSAWTCAPDNDVQYSAGTGLTLDVNQFSINPSQTQARVVGFCPPGQSIRAVDAVGAVTCQTDTNSGGTVTQIDTGAGLTGGPISTGGTVSVAPEGIASGMIANSAVVSSKIADGAVEDIKIPSASVWHNKQPKHAGAVYRWQEFDTYAQAGGWLMGNNPAMYGGLPPSAWTDGYAAACSMNPDKEVLRTLLTRKGYGGRNAVIMSKVYHQYSSTTGHMVITLFRIHNTTASIINWTPYFYYTCYGGWNELASVALNGQCIWNSGGNNSSSSGNQAAITLSVPANRVSTVIFAVPSGAPFGVGSNIYERGTVFAFYNDSLQLPAGLEYVDDFDTATGGWDQ